MIVEQEKFEANKEDWETLISFLPMGWQEKAKELGALKRQRNFKSSESLLRTLLIHFIDGCSLRETVERARLGEIAEVSDVALLKRLNRSGEWLRYMAVELMRQWIPRQPSEIFPSGLNVRIVDGSQISEPGSTGSDWRIHYSIKLFSLQCDEMKITNLGVGETFKNFSVAKGDLFIGDRGYCHRQGIEHVVKYDGHVLVRINLTNLPLYYKDNRRINLLKKLKTLRGTKVGNWQVYIHGDRGIIKGRICAIRKSKVVAERARKKLLRECSKKGRKVKDETLESTGYIFVFTTLPDAIVSATMVLEVYRGRWQIEVVFKRLKSIVGVGHLPKYDPVGAKAWLHGKIFTAFLIETLLCAGELFFPWGYPIPKKIE